MSAPAGMPRADGLRFLRRVVLVLCLAVVALAVLLVIALLSITESRRDAIRITCEQQNMRHDTTIRALDDIIASVPPERRKRARQGRSNTVLLIDALAPKFPDCDARAHKLVP